MYQGLRHGAQLWARAKHVGRQMDHGIHFAARLYANAIQPGLRIAGVDTGAADKQLKAAYNHYDLLKNQAQAGIRIADGVAAHVRSGYAYA
jgi:hypothetical protein